MMAAYTSSWQNSGYGSGSIHYPELGYPHCGGLDEGMVLQHAAKLVEQRTSDRIRWKAQNKQNKQWSKERQDTNMVPLLAPPEFDEEEDDPLSCGPHPSSMPLPFQGGSKVSPPLFTSPQQKGFDVQIAGLPANLRSREMMEAMLEQAVLTAHLTDLRFFKDVAQLSFSTLCAAEVAVDHFAGGKWNVWKVTARLVPQSEGVPREDWAPAKVAQRQPPPRADQHKPGRLYNQSYPDHHAYAEEGLPRALAAGPVHRMQRWDAPTSLSEQLWQRGAYRGYNCSDASTNVSEEDAEHDWWMGDYRPH